MKKHIAIALSGGVDSALSAWLLCQKGYQVTGVFMRNWMEDNDPHCQADQDAQDAQMVCDQLNIPLHQVNFSKDYWERVFQKTLDEFAQARTPNPDIWCNREIKFSKLLEYILETLNADALATGHYAQIRKNNEHYSLYQAVDHNKDQTYFLYTLNQHQLKHCMFPLGQMDKSEVRDMARKVGLVNHAKKDSTGICFIGERRFKDFLSQFLISKPGNIETEEGLFLGKHDGVIFYTIGQRQGLNIGGQSQFKDEAWYVLAKDIKRNVLIVGQGKNHPSLFHKHLITESFHWIGEKAPAATFSCFAKVRYRQPPQACLCQLTHTGISLEFEIPQRAITAGQSVVLYTGKGECLGGGIINQKN